MNSAQLLIKSKPIWHEAAPRALPVTVRSVYTVLGKKDQRWQTVLRTTDNIDTARTVMDTANDSGQYDRLVIATGNSVNQAPAASWTTIECAMPPKSFQQMLARLQYNAVNSNQNSFYLVGEKESQKLLLTLAMVLAIATQNVFAIGVVATCAIFDLIFMMDKRPMTIAKSITFNRTRNWAYAGLSGALLLMLIF